jgi:processing peptidase subunit alpha
VEVSKLANGLTVASQDAHGAVASIGLYFKAGSRYEAVPGTAHLLEHVAFGSTQHRSALKLYRDVEAMGGSLDSAATREHVSWPP